MRICYGTEREIVEAHPFPNKITNIPKIKLFAFQEGFILVLLLALYFAEILEISFLDLTKPTQIYDNTNISDVCKLCHMCGSLVHVGNNYLQACQPEQARLITSRHGRMPCQPPIGERRCWPRRCKENMLLQTHLLKLPAAPLRARPNCVETRKAA